MTGNARELSGADVALVPFGLPPALRAFSFRGYGPGAPPQASRSPGTSSEAPPLARFSGSGSPEAAIQIPALTHPVNGVRRTANKGEALEAPGVDSAIPDTRRPQVMVGLPWERSLEAWGRRCYYRREGRQSL